MIVPLRDSLAKPLIPVRLPSLAWGFIYTDDDHGAIISRLNGYVDGLEAVRQTVHAIVHTERYSVPHMHPDDGIEMEQFIGRSFNYFRAKIKNVLNDALLRDDRITGLEILRIFQEAPGSVQCEVKIYSIYGAVDYGFNTRL